ncbi:MFS general substrate transporter [Gonapodya prolifera JEL478]|uniref:MFS general substrate transporter n=1 Tax=Gonapodya prolifera (strain JEL478) TaxID=1344416 RepID=A0A139A0Y9_GONPJ|nr:MFS general substrate transporter [Gonapodya prolifera JEL478]|eukprot:KXS10288.1 MFS general substrate transporter [Gonapodya prolifera JEL478]
MATQNDSHSLQAPESGATDALDAAGESLVSQGEVKEELLAGAASKTDRLSPAPAPEEDAPPEGGAEAWGVVGAYWFISFMSVGLIYVWAIYLRYYFRNDTYPGTPQSVYSLTGGLANAAGFAAGPLLGSMADRHGYRIVVFISAVFLGGSYLVTSFAGPNMLPLLIVFQGAAQGVSSQGCWMVAMAAIPQYFKRRRGMVMGVAMTGGGMGGLALTNLTQYLLDRFGPPWTLRITGFIVLVVMVPASYFVRTRLPPKPNGKLFNIHAFRDVRFVLLFLSGVIMYFAYPLPQFFMSSYAISIGIDAQIAALILGLQFAVTAPTRVVYGLLMDRIGPVNVFLACNYVGGVLCLTLWPNARSLGSVVAFAMVFGATGGQFFSQVPIVISSIFGHHDSASIMGMVLLSLSVGSLVGTLAGGKLLDTHTTPNPLSPSGYDQDFVPVMMYTGTLYIVSATIMLVLRWRLVGWRLRVKV